MYMKYVIAAAPAPYASGGCTLLPVSDNNNFIRYEKLICISVSQQLVPYFILIDER